MIRVKYDDALILTDEFSRVGVSIGGKPVKEEQNVLWHGSPLNFKTFKAGTHFSSNPTTSAIWIMDSSALGSTIDKQIPNVDTTLYKIRLKPRATVYQAKEKEHTIKGINVYKNSMPIRKGLMELCQSEGFQAVTLPNVVDGHAGRMEKYTFVYDPRIIILSKVYKAYVVDFKNKFKKKDYTTKKIKFRYNLFGIPYHVPITGEET
jgi:hypothetical protein